MDPPGFVGRAEELARLHALAASPHSQLLPIYGRRRVGKTELILHFLKAQTGLYFLGKEASAPLQIREFLRTAARSLGEPLLEMLQADDWKSALQAVVSRLPRNAARRGPKFVLALDEFQWMAAGSPELPSILQELWDLAWKKRGDIFLILCGSYLGFMEREVLGNKSPLFGRRTGQILLRPFTYREAAEFHPGLSLPDRARIYFLCGGIPYYLRFFSGRQSIAQEIRDNFLDPYAALHREPEFLLREELRELQNYYAILTAIATGSLTASEIAKRAGLGERNLPYYMNALIELGYVVKRYPLTGRRPAARSVRFAIEDAALRFWFRFIFPNSSSLAQLGPGGAYRELVAPNLDAYFGACFDRLCREALPALYRKEGVEANFEVGEFWDKGTQIDVVGYRDDGVIDLAECRWGAVRSWPKLRAELAAKLRAYPNPDNLTLRPRLFARLAPPQRVKLGGIAVHDLEALYA